MSSCGCPLDILHSFEGSAFGQSDNHPFILACNTLELTNIQLLKFNPLEVPVLLSVSGSIQLALTCQRKILLSKTRLRAEHSGDIIKHASSFFTKVKSI